MSNNTYLHKKEKQFDSLESYDIVMNIECVFTKMKIFLY